ncbi:hypothetical protein ACD661_05050 [Legionella lytica]|uniref:Uncharacterized protein n=1 Tax=Legionella lytica TaxID=96232 RepID=A0ABW8D5F8_9GAMM
MKLKIDPSKSPTFNYFIIRINHNNGDNGANKLHAYKTAMDYVRKQYPDALAGNSYWLQAKNVPLTDLYFLRCLTFRSYVPPYTDEGLDAFRKQVEDYVQQKTVIEGEPQPASAEFGLI